MPTTTPHEAQNTSVTLWREPSGMIVFDANTVPSHFGHLGVAVINCAMSWPNDQAERRRKGNP
jgi:hypothetical protein